MLSFPRSLVLAATTIGLVGCMADEAGPDPLITEPASSGPGDPLPPAGGELVAWPDPFGDRTDCEDFQNYPPVPPYVAPGDHCSVSNPTPECPPELEDICEIPCSGWEGPYNIYGDNCHDAANCGVGAGQECGQETGILSCTGNTSGIGGHTVNYTVVPYEAPEDETSGTSGTSGTTGDATDTTGNEPDQWVICLSEPQHTNCNASKCCWLQDSPTPQTGEGEPGHACYEARCGSQAQDDGGTVLPVGECWPTISNEPPCDPPWSQEALECCQEYTKRWDHALPKMCKNSTYENQVDFRCDVYVECVEAAGWPPNQGASSSSDGGDSSSSTGDSPVGTEGAASGTGGTSGSYGGSTSGSYEGSTSLSQEEPLHSGLSGVHGATSMGL
ncbi:MAG: hypothetical protein AAGF11_49495 [Myxococcota bacterium]